MASKIRRVSVSRDIPCTPSAAFEHFNDYSRWKDWAGFPSVSLEIEGETYPGGKGAIRRFAILPPVREEIIEFSPGRAMSYRLLSGAPIKEHTGTMRFDDKGTGCAITWETQYQPIIPGSGLLIDPVVGWFFQRILRRFSVYIEQLDA